MKRGTAIGLVILLTAAPASAGSDPPQITWEWFSAAEVYKRYPNRNANDLRIAAHYHRLAAERGNASSAYKLAEMYENGVGVTQDYGTALRWYRAAADRGDRYGQFRVGFFYQKGLGTQQDAGEAARWYGLAALQDNEWAWHMLAFMYAEGEGVPKDTARARSYFERSLPRTGDNWAKWKLATLIAGSDPARARRLLREAAAGGIAQAGDELRARGW